MKFEGPCPFLSCVKQEPHIHPACEVCGALNFGNLSCATCWAIRMPHVKRPPRPPSS